MRKDLLCCREHRSGMSTAHPAHGQAATPQPPQIVLRGRAKSIEITAIKRFIAGIGDVCREEENYEIRHNIRAACCWEDDRRL